MGYANKTTVSEEKSKHEIESLLMRHGADSFGYMRGKQEIQIMFELNGFSYRLAITIPTVEQFMTTATGRERKVEAAHKEQDQETRRLWRALALWLKAMIVADTDGIVTLKQSLLPFTMLPNGDTFSQYALPQLELLQSNGKMPTLLSTDK